VQTFFFNIRYHSGNVVQDIEGSMLLTLQDAREVAMQSICEIVGESIRYNEQVLVKGIDVHDETGRFVLEVTVPESLQPLMQVA
jgi:hypothetical protein